MNTVPNFSDLQTVFQRRGVPISITKLQTLFNDGQQQNQQQGFQNNNDLDYENLCWQTFLNSRRGLGFWLEQGTLNGLIQGQQLSAQQNNNSDLDFHVCEILEVQLISAPHKTRQKHEFKFQYDFERENLNQQTQQPQSQAQQQPQQPQAQQANAINPTDQTAVIQSNQPDIQNLPNLPSKRTRRFILTDGYNRITAVEKTKLPNDIVKGSKIVLMNKPVMTQVTVNPAQAQQQGQNNSRQNINQNMNRNNTSDRNNNDYEVQIHPILTLRTGQVAVLWSPPELVLGGTVTGNSGNDDNNDGTEQTSRGGGGNGGGNNDDDNEDGSGRPGGSNAMGPPRKKAKARAKKRA